MESTPDGDYGEDEDDDEKGASSRVIVSAWTKAVHPSQRGRREISWAHLLCIVFSGRGT